MAAVAVLVRNKRSFFEEDVYDRSKRLRYSSSSIPPQHVTPLRRPAQETEPECFEKRTKLTHHENLSNNLNGAQEWVELFVRKMSSATSVDDAKARAAKALEAFEKSIRSRDAAEDEVAAVQKHEENMALKQEVEVMRKENMILKRGVFIQNERLKEFEDRNQDFLFFFEQDRNQEFENMKQVLNQYKKRVSELEVANYGLELHLKQAQQSNNSMSFHPHVF